MRGSALIISGPSGVGKGKISRAIAETLGATLSVSATTRPIAVTERKDQDYTFVDQAKFDELCEKGAFLEWAKKFGYSYGTLRQPIEDALADGQLVILEIDVIGATKVSNLIPEVLGIFILPPSEEALFDRLRQRGRDQEEDIEIRISEASCEISLAKSSGIYDFFVVNDDLEMTIAKILEWVRYEINSAAR